MNYQLVLQFKGDSIEDYDSMVAIEDELIQELADVGEVDGHDAGSGGTNIFIITSAPVQAFERSKVVLERSGLLGAVAAAYRPVAGNTYTVLWPHHQEAFSVA